MAIQYYMRAYKTTPTAGYVDWVVNDTPDTTGAFSGFNPADLTNITVNRVVGSKTENWLQPDQGYITADGKFFHINSYDQLHAANAFPASPTVIPVPTGFVGIAVARGGTTNSSGVLVPGASTNFFSTLLWDEAQARWRFVRNTNGDHTTLGSTQDVSMGNMLSDGYLKIDGYIAVGILPALTGIIRIPNNQFIVSRNATNTGDGYVVGLDNVNRVRLGSLVSDQVFVPGNLRVGSNSPTSTDGYIRDGSTTPADGTGNPFIRVGNSTTIISARDTAGTANLALITLNNTNNLIVGNAGATAGSNIYNVGTSVFHQFQTNTVTFLEMGTAGTPASNDPNNFARFTAAIVNPTVYQTHATVGSGQLLNFQAQSTTAASQTGGAVALTAGSAPASGFGGTVDLLTGNVGSFPVTATLKMRIHPTVAPTAANSNSIQYFENLFRVDTAQTAPLFRQDDTASTPGAVYTIQAQNSTNGAGIGGILALTSGNGTATAGQVLVQTGGTTQIIVSPTFIAPGTTTATAGSVVIRGSLEVVGTTTTVDSTVVDIIGRVIHSNWADPVVSPNVAVPTLVTGYSVHRGNIAGTPRDGAAWIWTEGALPSGSDGYWRAITTPGDGYGADNTNATNTTTSFGVIARSFNPSPDPSPVAGTLPAVGGIRTPNNLTSVAARNVTPTTTITGGPGATLSNLATLPQATINVVSTTGFTAAGTLLIFSDAGVQTVTYTGTTGTTFTGATGGTGLLHAGSFVAQTNNTTTIAAGSNGAVLPQATINVASTVGFPASGTIRIISNGTTGGTQTITYTGTGATTFTGCTGGTGTLATGNSVTSLAITGNADLLLIGTDFGNRIVYGSPTTGTGHIFNTPTNTLFDFQVNGVPQIRIQANDTNSDGYVEVLEVEPTVSNPRVAQLVRPDFGANAGFNLVLQAQNGQNQTGATTNNNGGNLVLASGSAGTGGSVATGTHGSVDIQTDSEIKVRVFPTFAASAPNSNTMLIEESIIRIGPTQNVPRIRQDSTTNASGQSFSLQAQNAATTGGPLLLQSGTGATNDGYINLITGTTTKVTIFPTTAISAGDNNSILYFENLFRVDTAQTNPVFRQDTTGGASGQVYTIQAQNAVTTGGNLVLTSGTGATAGNTQLQTGGVDRVVVHPAFTEFRDTAEAVRVTPVSAGTTAVTFASTVTAVTVSQTTTGGATGATTTLQAQNAATTGGALTLTSGTGGTTNGAVNLQVGGVTTASLVTNKFVFNAGRRRHTTNITTTYPVVATDDYIAITTLAAPFTITLPATPTAGDEYVVKDATGNAGVSNVTVSGNGNNIDGFASFLLSQPYAAATFTFVNGQWSVT